VKWGIFSQPALLEGEPKAKYNRLLRGLYRHFAPEGTLEESLVEKLAVLMWRQRRLLIAEAAEIRKGCGFFDSDKKQNELDVLRANVPHTGYLDRLLRYEASLERAFDRTMSQLERLQKMRLGQPVPPRIEVELN
jgi:hypothetical protein